MSNIPNLVFDMGMLVAQFENLNNNLKNSNMNAFFKASNDFQKEFKKFVKLPLVKSGLDAVKTLGKAMKQMSDLQSRSLATEKGLLKTISVDQIGASVALGVGLDALTTQVISLREKGVQRLDRSTLNLLARMKSTGQSTESLIKFLGANTSYLNLNQKQAQELAASLGKYARVFGTRQDEIIKLSADLSKNLQFQSQLGAGAGIVGGFGTFGASLGGRGSELINQAVQFFSNASLAQLQLLGIAEGFQERLAEETDPMRQKAIVEQMIKTAAQTVESIKGGLGKDVTSSRILEQILQPFGGQNALVFPQLVKAMEDAKDPMFDLSQSLTGLSQLAEVFAMPMKYLGAALTEFINLPGVKQLANGLAMFAGVVVPYMTISKIINLAAVLYSNSNKLFVMAVRSFGLNVKMFRAASGFGAALNPYMMLVGGIFALIGIVSAMKDETEDINKKTPDPNQKTITSAGLTGQIFSQLVNIVTSQSTNVIQREMLATQKELVRLAQKQNDINAPNSGLPTRQVRSGAQP